MKFLSLLPIATMIFCNCRPYNDIEVLQRKSVALVDRSEEVYCGGTFVDYNLILTSAHCIDIDDSIIYYATFNDFDEEMHRRLDYVREAKMIGYNPKIDLALLETNGFNNSFAKIAFEVEMGETLQTVFHADFYPWMFNRGSVAGVLREHDQDLCPIPINEQLGLKIVQMNLPVHSGNSGSAVFNENFELMGVISWHSTVSQISTAVHRDEIVKFIDESRR